MTGLGAVVGEESTRFAVRSPRARRLWLCLFDGEAETRHEMAREGDVWSIELPGNLAGRAYGYRAEGKWAPDRACWFDPAKLLVDPYAIELDRRFTQDPSLAVHGKDTAAIVPRAIVPAPGEPLPPEPPHFVAGGLIYEINVRGFTKLHPHVPERLRGTIAALAHPAVLAHLKKLNVTAVELMPVVAWIDERHLPPLGLVNAWGYNPVGLMALDPGLCPGGVAELRETVAALHAEGIGVLLDLVFNHTGESDVEGGVISLRGLDDAVYARAPDGSLINDTGCGNTLDFANPVVRSLALDAMRHFVQNCGVDGFRFDLAPVLARGSGFDPAAPIFIEIEDDPVLADRVLIAEPWDLGPGGYQLGNFPAHWLEWNDRFRDDARRFWKEEEGIGTLATRLAGSSDIFGPHWPHADCRSVNFLAAHDGFTLADLVAYENRHNEANGEHNRDGQAENFSWNNGTEGSTGDPHVLAARASDQRALLGTLFASTGTIMLTAGDEFGRTQRGNNNAYCQDNEIGWIDWQNRDRALEDHVARLSLVRAKRRAWFARFPDTVVWHTLDGRPKTVADWENSHSPGFVYEAREESAGIRVEVRRHEREVRLRAI